MIVESEKPSPSESSLISTLHAGFKLDQMSALSEMQSRKNGIELLDVLKVFLSSTTSLHTFQHSERQSSSIQESQRFEESQQFQCIQGKGQVCIFVISSAEAFWDSQVAKQGKKLYQGPRNKFPSPKKCFTLRNRLCGHSAG